MTGIRSIFAYTMVAGVFAWGTICAEAKTGDGHAGHEHGQNQVAEEVPAKDVVCPSCKTVAKKVPYSKNLRKRVHVCPTCKTKTKPGDSDITEKIHLCEKCDTLLEQCSKCRELVKKTER